MVICTNSPSTYHKINKKYYFATCSPLTVSRIEKGAPTVAIGIYLRVLYALQLDDDILSLAKDDKIGRALQDMNLPQRVRASKKQ